MKKILFGLLAVVLFASCEDKTAYSVSGTFPDVADGTEVSIYADSKGKEVVVTTTAKAGKFVFEGKQVEPIARYLSVEGNDNFKRPVLFILEAGKIDVALVDNKVTITGSPLNDANTKFWREFRKQDEPNYDSIKAFADENIGNALGVVTFASNYYLYKLDEMKETYAKVSDAHKALPSMERIAKSIEAQEKSAVGMKFIDIKGLSPEGTELSLSDYAGKGKIVLVDFWASWCPPCVADMPYLVDAYAKYKNKGFEIVGVSLDSKNDDWKAGIAKLNVTWPQMSDLKGWESELSKPYAVSSIPHTILIDKDGTILEKQIHGKDLDAKLAELLK